MPAELHIRRTGEGDVETVMALLAEATSWLAERGSDQWQLSRRRRLLVDRDIRNRTNALLFEAGNPVGTITLDELADSDFWRRSDGVGSALYVHRMAVARDHAGQGIGSTMLDWAGRCAVRRGHRTLRLDAWRTNGDLHKYYEDQGFVHLRTCSVQGRGSGALFERPAGLQLGQGPRLASCLTAERESLGA